MIPGPYQVIGCPACGVPALVATLISGNTIGAVLWSDGNMLAPMLPEASRITRCRRCGEFYWVDAAPVLGEIPPYARGWDSPEIPSEWTSAEETPDLLEREFLQCISRGLAHDRDQELYLRIRAWRTGNDRVRSLLAVGKVPSVWKRSLAATKNLQLLSEMLDTDDPDQRILRAEAKRELGHFREAVALLATAMPEDRRSVVDFVRGLAENKDALVRPLPHEVG